MMNEGRTLDGDTITTPIDRNLGGVHLPNFATITTTDDSYPE